MKRKKDEIAVITRRAPATVTLEDAITAVNTALRTFLGVLSLYLLSHVVKIENDNPYKPKRVILEVKRAKRSSESIIIVLREVSS